MFITTKNRVLASTVALLIATASTACAGSASDNSTTRSVDGKQHIKVMMFQSQALRFPSVVAKEQGIFEREGLDVEFVDQPSTLGVVQALQATGAQLAQPTDPSFVESWQSGAKLKIACGQQNKQLMSLLAPTDTKLKTLDEVGGDWKAVVSQLKGKTIGFPTPEGTGIQKLFAQMLRDAGVDDVTYVNVGASTPQVEAALQHGSVDVAATYPTGTQFIKQNGTAKELIFLPDGPELYSGVHFSTWSGLPDWIDQNPDTVAAFCRSISAAIAYIHDESNRDTLVPVLSEDTGVNESVARQVLEDGVFDSYTTELTKETWDSTVQAYIDAGVVKSDPRPSYEEVVGSNG